MKNDLRNVPSVHDLKEFFFVGTGDSLFFLLLLLFVFFIIISLLFFDFYPLSFRKINSNSKIWEAPCSTLQLQQDPIGIVWKTITNKFQSFKEVLSHWDFQKRMQRKLCIGNLLSKNFKSLYSIIPLIHLK